MALPAVVLDPTADAVRPRRRSGSAPRLWFSLPDVGEVDVGEAVLGVEGDEQRSVADRDCFIFC